MINDAAVMDVYRDKDTQEWVSRRRLGYTPTSLEAHNFLRYDYNAVMQNARACDYRLRDDILAELAETLEPAEYETVKSIDASKTGPTYGFDYESLGPVQRV